MASEEWRPAGPAVCRCCFAEGCYKDISSEYFWMGKKEVYADMLNETFNINISHSKWSGPSSTSRLICEACIARLRDAAEFKKQVVECEKTFMQHLDPTTSSLQPEVECEVPAAEVKLEGVKVEKLLEDEDDFDNRMGFDDDDEDMDQPLVSLASKVPKKEQINVLDLLKGTEVVVKKKKSVMRAKEPLQKVKVKKVVRPAPPPKPDKAVPKKKECSERHNARTILKHTTAIPFKLPDTAMMCVFCCAEFERPSLFREHVKSEHPGDVYRYVNSTVKADCTELECRVCKAPFEAIEAAAAHLNEAHNLRVKLNEDLGLRQFTFKDDRWVCYTCQDVHFSLRALSRHVETHFGRYTCETCGRAFTNECNLQKHLKFVHANNKRLCRRCSAPFDTAAELRKHLESSKRCCRFQCVLCGERFITNNNKAQHMAAEHSVSHTHACLECGQTYSTRTRLKKHFVVSHTTDFAQCQFCDKRFESKNRYYEDHLLTHTKERTFCCDVCSKMFARKDSLWQHMWIHREVKRFRCDPCKKQFNQKVTWKGHMKANHPEIPIDN